MRHARVGSLVLFTTLFLASLPMIAFVGGEQSFYEVINGQAQGTTYHITFQKGRSTVTKMQVDSVLQGIDRSLSLWVPNSLINTFNASGRLINMDSHMSTVVLRALEVAKSSGGTFDITVKPLVDAWGLGVKHGGGQIPSLGELARIKACVGSKFLSVRGRKLVKSRPCTQIDANGIAQGYSVDVLAGLLESKGIHDYLVELGGEIRVSGVNSKGVPWTIGVEAAASNANEDAGLSATLQPGSGGITTAGNYRKYVESGGKRFSHIIDPRSGRPVDNGIVSVTVRAATAMDADAWDDALMVLGVDSSFQLLASHPELQARFILATPDGRSRDTATAGFFVTTGRAGKRP